MQPDTIKVFISHHHSPDENAFTARLVGDLRTAGADIWVDDVEITSDNFVKKINDGLTGRHWLVLVMTPASISSVWVQEEVNAALNQVRKGKMRGVVPVMAQACDDDLIPVLWDTLHRYDATSDYDAALAGLCRSLGLAAAAPIEPAPPPAVETAAPPSEVTQPTPSAESATPAPADVAPIASPTEAAPIAPPPAPAEPPVAETAPVAQPPSRSEPRPAASYAAPSYPATPVSANRVEIEGDPQARRFTSVAAAIEAAEAGARIQIFPGTYRETHLRIYKPVELLGQGKTSDVIIEFAENDDGSGHMNRESGVTIIANGRLSGLTLLTTIQGTALVIRNVLGSVVIEDCAISGYNKPSGIWVEGSEVHIRGTRIEGTGIITPDPTPMSAERG